MEHYRQQAALLKAIGHPVRLQIVDLLRVEPECVCHLSAALNKSQPYVSQQLAILRNAKVIVDERDGTNIYYRLADDNVARQVAAACADCRRATATAGSPRRPSPAAPAPSAWWNVAQGARHTSSLLTRPRSMRDGALATIYHPCYGGLRHDPAHQDSRRRLRQL